MPTILLPREIAELAGCPEGLRGDRKVLTNRSDEVTNADLI
jgi:hypothetical protein